MRILMLSTYDRGGGAENGTFALCRIYRRHGHDARLYVRYKRTEEAFVHEIDPYAHAMPWAPLCRRLESQVRARPKFRGQYRMVEALRSAALPRRWLDRFRGVEDFNYPYAWHLTDAEDGWEPDVVHANNLHGDYFDLRALRHLCTRLPVIWTLRDTWALTGHCGFFIDCDRWRTGCGACPDLARHPAIRRDNTAANWERKRQIYSKSRLAVSTPSQWLMDCVDQSMLQPWRTRVVPNGVDLNVFCPGDRVQARTALGLPFDAFIGVFVSFTGAGTNPYKDYKTIHAAAQRLATQALPGRFMLLCVGGQPQAQENPNIRYTGYLSDPQDLARHYRSADVLLHAANAETFGFVVTEAMACGVPAVATDVGGIPEQVVHGETGFLTPRSDSEAMAERVRWLMNHREEGEHMGKAAAIRARQTFDLNRQAETFLAWFAELRAEYQEPPPPPREARQ